MAEMLIKMTKEPFMEWFSFTLENGHTVEVDAVEGLDWLKKHGAKDEEKAQKALDECWNFYEAELVVKDFKEPVGPNDRIKPQI